MATRGSAPPPTDGTRGLTTSGGYVPPPAPSAPGAPAASHWPPAPPPGAGFAPPFASAYAPPYELGSAGRSVVVVHHMVPDGVAPSAGAPFGGPHHYHLHQQHVHSHPYHHHHYHVHDPYLQHYRQQHPYHAYHLLVQQPHVHLHQHAMNGFSPHLGTPAPLTRDAPARPPTEGGTPSATSTTTPSVDANRPTALSAQRTDEKAGQHRRVPAAKPQQHKSFIHVEPDPTAQPPAPPPGRSARQLIVNYLDNEATGSELMRIFGTVGAVESARVMYDAKTNEPLGYGFVYMERAEDASRAVTLLNRYPLRKKRLKVSFANPKRDNAPAPTTKPRPLSTSRDDYAHPTPDPSATTGPTSGPSGSFSGPTSGPSGSSGNGSGGSDASSTS